MRFKGYYRDSILEKPIKDILLRTESILTTIDGDTQNRDKCYESDRFKVYKDINDIYYVDFGSLVSLTIYPDYHKFVINWNSDRTLSLRFTLTCIAIELRESPVYKNRILTEDEIWDELVRSSHIINRI